MNRTYFYLAFACLAFNMMLGLMSASKLHCATCPHDFGLGFLGFVSRSMLAYLALWCTVVLKIEEPWETKHPKAIPVMAIVGFSTAT